MGLPRFLAELKHRKVYRVAVVYAAVGWALLEMADVVLPRLDLPDWTVNVVLAVVLLGFPLVVVFAWVFDFSEQGVVRTEPLSPSSHPNRFSVAALVEFVLILGLVLVVGGLYVDRLSLQKRLVEYESALPGNTDTGQPDIPNPEQYRAMAVLPFADMSEAGDQAWFAEGIAEELLQALARVEGLQVMARTSSFAFKNTEKTIAEIAEILGVQAVLEGSVRRFGDRVRITAQLVDASSGYHIWSGSYERQVDDIFQLQDELARAIVIALQAELGVNRTEPLIATQTSSQEAYNWFLRGRALADWSTPQTTTRAIEYFEKAVETDPNYAPAWAYLAMAHSQLIVFLPFDEVVPSTVEAYESALALDPQQREALNAKATITQILYHDYETAGKLYQQAYSSGYIPAGLPWYTIFFLVSLDQIPLAIQLAAEAEQVDPLNALTKTTLGYLYRFAGDTDMSITKSLEALALSPDHEIALAQLVNSYAYANRFVEGQRLLDQLPPAKLERPRTKLQVGLFYAAKGDRQKALKIYQDLTANLPPYGMLLIAELALKLGKVAEAIDLMEREVEINSFNQFWARPLFRNEPAVQNHPRFQALLQRIGLDDESVEALHQKLSFE
jgi:TolB-like protein/Flp pilus assembly protein TadD